MWMNDTWDVRCDEKRGDGEADPNPCPLSRSGPFHFLEASDTVSDKSHQPWGIVTGNNSGQDARAAGDSNHRRPGESLVAHEAPVPLSFAPNAWPSSTVIQGYTFSRVSVPSKNSRRLRLRLGPRARRPCRCPPSLSLPAATLDPPRIATSRHRRWNKHPPATASSHPACLSQHCPQPVLLETLPPRHLDHKFLRALGAETTSPAQPQALPPPPPPSPSLASVGQYERVGEMDPP